MTVTNATAFRKNLFSYLENTVRYNEVININTKNGNAIVMSEDDYRGLMDTLYLTSIPGMEQSIIDGINTPDSECLTGPIEW